MLKYYYSLKTDRRREMRIIAPTECIVIHICTKIGLISKTSMKFNNNSYKHIATEFQGKNNNRSLVSCNRKQ